MGTVVFAEGMEAALRLSAGFASEAEAAAFWAVGAAEVPTQDPTYPGAADQTQQARLYRGALPAPAPVLIFIHGGG